ncbi:MAG TPA: fibronectin type III domain-containing protein [Polyangiaceae bacterium]|jgi:predicted phage tail protein
MTKRQNRAFVVTGWPTSIPALVMRVRAVIVASTGNPFLPEPRPSLAKLRAAVSALERAETATATRAQGTKALRDAAHTALLDALRIFKAYVQERADANPEQAETIITSAGLNVRKPTTRVKSPFVAKQGLSGTMHLEVKAPAKRASYQWEWRVAGTARWTRAEPTIQAKTTITGLPIGTYVDFRFRTVTKAGESDWSEPLTVLVK